MTKQGLLELTLTQLKARRTAVEETVQWAENALSEARMAHLPPPADYLPADTTYSDEDAPHDAAHMVTSDIPFAILLVQGLIKLMNPAFEGLTGYTTSDENDSPPSLFNLVTRKDAPKLFRLLSELMQDPLKRTATFRTESVHCNKEKFDAIFTLAVMREASGIPAYLTCQIQAVDKDRLELNDTT